MKALLKRVQPGPPDDSNVTMRPSGDPEFDIPDLKDSKFRIGVERGLLVWPLQEQVEK